MEANRKRVQVHMLPTEDGVIDGSLISRAIDNKLAIANCLTLEDKNAKRDGHINNYLYFTTDEEIKEGDWFYNPATKGVLYASKEMLSWNCDTTQEHKGWKKIIATTDPKLTTKEVIKVGDGVHSDKQDFNDQIVITESSAKLYNESDHYFKQLPQPSQAFIEAYCKQGGIDEVDVEYENIVKQVPTGETTFGLGLQIKKDKIVGRKQHIV
jgi:hypothetical protein